MPDNVTEVRGEFQDVLVISELRGGFPNVAIASDVDYAGLIAGDDNPFFVTLPIGKAGVTSGNKRHYDEAWLQELERQTITNKPVGLLGHLPAADRAHAMPVEAIHWVGVLRDGDTLWGKGYVPPGEARTRIARYRAHNKKIATSIDAEADGTWDEAIKAFRMDARTLKLGQIDIAPADRAGIPALAEVPYVTTEMITDEPVIEQEIDMPEKGKLDYINEMTADDARLLPEPVRQALLATVAIPPEVAQAQELRAALGVDDKADLAKLITEMKQTQEAQAKAAVKARITELATAVKVEDVRGIVIEMVEGKNPQTPQEAETAYTQVVEMQTIKNLLASSLQNTMGPPQRGSVQRQQGQNKYFVIPQEA